MEKDHEVVLMQSPDDGIITEYTSSIYLLYALFHRYGMSLQMFGELHERIMNLEPFRFNYCDESEKEGILLIIKSFFIVEHMKKIVVKMKQVRRFCLWACFHIHYISGTRYPIFPSSSSIRSSISSESARTV